MIRSFVAFVFLVVSCAAHAETMTSAHTYKVTGTINGEPGLVIYAVDGNGLDGLWSVRGQNGSGTEHLTPAD